MSHKSVVWIQIPATELERAMLFYHEVFGFQFFMEELNGIPHAMFKEDLSGQKPIHGALIEVAELPEEGVGPRLFFDASGKFDEMQEAIERNGGKVIIRKTLIKDRGHGRLALIPKTYIDDAQGYYAQFYDSEGNRMGLYGRS